MEQDFVIQRIILQRKEKISILKKTLNKTASPDIQESIQSQIKEQEKELDYFENMEVTS